MNRNKVSLPISAPLLFDDDDLRIIVSALKMARKKAGSRRADELIIEFENRLANPDTHRIDLLPFE